MITQARVYNALDYTWRSARQIKEIICPRKVGNLGDVLCEVRVRGLYAHLENLQRQGFIQTRDRTLQGRRFTIREYKLVDQRY